MCFVIVSLIELLLYYICIIFIATKILGAIPIYKNLIPSFLFFIPIFIGGILCSNDSFVSFHALFQIIEILLLRIILKRIKLGTIISTYLLLFLTNVILSSCLIFIFFIQEKYELLIEFIVNLSTMGVCLFISYSKHNQKIKQIINWTPRAIKRLVLLLLSLCTILVVLIIHVSFFENAANWSLTVKIILLLFILFLLAALPILIIYSMATTHFKKLSNSYEQQISVQAEHYRLLSQSNYEIRKFKHDYNNMCIGLNELIAENKNEAALEMLENSSIKLNTTVKFDTGNGIVDALLTDKQNQANKINAQIRFEGCVTPNKIKPADLCIIFGNTIDNALEACEKMDISIKKVISVSSTCNSGFMFIKIVNPVSQKVETQGNIPETTKKDKTAHGFGLHSLEQVVKHYNGNLTLTCDSDNFQVDIELCL